MNIEQGMTNIAANSENGHFVIFHIPANLYSLISKTCSEALVRLVFAKTFLYSPVATFPIIFITCLPGERFEDYEHLSVLILPEKCKDIGIGCSVEAESSHIFIQPASQGWI